MEHGSFLAEFQYFFSFVYFPTLDNNKVIVEGDNDCEQKLHLGGLDYLTVRLCSPFGCDPTKGCLSKHVSTELDEVCQEFRKQQLINQGRPGDESWKNYRCCAYDYENPNFECRKNLEEIISKPQ